MYKHMQIPIFIDVYTYIRLERCSLLLSRFLRPPLFGM